MYDLNPQATRDTDLQAAKQPPLSLDQTWTLNWAWWGNAALIAIIVAAFIWFVCYSPKSEQAP